MTMLLPSCSSVQSSDSSVTSDNSTLASSLSWCHDGTSAGSGSPFSSSSLSSPAYCIELGEIHTSSSSTTRGDSYALRGDETDYYAKGDRRKRWRPKVKWTIVCTFEVGDRSYVRDIDFATFRKWTAFSELLRVLENDFGTACVQLWDVQEDMEIMAGDWEARARPEWEVIVICGESLTDTDADSEIEYGSDEDYGDLTRGFEREMWWFSRWRRKVERKRIGFVKGERGWLVGAVGTVGIVAAFCIVLYGSSRFMEAS
ncbi:hypothetical protein P280DRAFT_262895 [Massarina eburnea CBS 473.64]|uniref:Uncharacterized protein n=1 Tax=Massarina eburnea CBS 473.64 TaxID=1395130 RepID=A0A6A6S7Z5_9PLEO|nr:hypothetical protein P280DRAFT_262895 [Massarina eburnea CBS 473.64]